MNLLTKNLVDVSENEAEVYYSPTPYGESLYGSILSLVRDSFKEIYP